MELVVDWLARSKHWLFVCVGGITQVQLVQEPRNTTAILVPVDPLTGTDLLLVESATLGAVQPEVFWSAFFNPEP